MLVFGCSGENASASPESVKGCRKATAVVLRSTVAEWWEQASWFDEARRLDPCRNGMAAWAGVTVEGGSERAHAPESIGSGRCRWCKCSWEGREPILGSDQTEGQVDKAVSLLSAIPA